MLPPTATAAGVTLQKMRRGTLGTVRGVVVTADSSHREIGYARRPPQGIVCPGRRPSRPRCLGRPGSPRIPAAKYLPRLPRVVRFLRPWYRFRLDRALAPRQQGAADRIDRARHAEEDEPFHRVAGAALR